jgi:hypothetical protein
MLFIRLSSITMKAFFLLFSMLMAVKGTGQTIPTHDTLTMKPLICKLTTPELQERKKTIIAELKLMMLEKAETANGIKFKFEASDRMLDLITSFIKTERLCCDFFIFTLTLSDASGYTWLELSGPQGTKEFIKTEIGF